MDNTRYKLLLYVAGDTEKSRALEEGIRHLLGDRLHLHFDLDAIDVLEHPSDAEKDGIIMTPTLIVKVPEPERRMFGNLLDSEKLMLVLHAAEPGPPSEES